MKNNAPETPVYSILRHDSVLSLGQLREDWYRLFNDSAWKNPFLRMQWYLSWFANCAAGGRAVYSVRANGKTVAIVPVCLRTRSVGPLKIRTVEPFFLDSIDYSDFLVAPDHDAAVWALFDELSKGYGNDLLQWTNVRPGSAAERVFEWGRRAGRKGNIREGEECVSIPLAPTFDEYLSALGKTKRDFIRRRAKKSQRIEGVRSVDSKEFSSSPIWLEQCIELEHRCFKDRESTGPLTRAGFSVFCVDLFRRLSVENRICFSGIAVENTLLAYTLGFVEDGIDYQYVTNFNEDYAKHSVGIYSLHELINREIEQKKVNTIDLMRGAEYYKRWFTNSVIRNKDYRFFANPLFESGWQIQYQIRMGVSAIRKRVKKKGQLVDTQGQGRTS